METKFAFLKVRLNAAKVLTSTVQTIPNFITRSLKKELRVTMI